MSQVAATAVLALAFWILAGRSHAYGAALGGLAVAAGSAVSAWFMVGGGVNPAGLVLGRWFVGLLAKWAIVLTLAWLGMAVWRVPALPLLAGLVVALVVNILAATRR